jgi:hypothetical protein
MRAPRQNIHSALLNPPPLPTILPLNLLGLDDADLPIRMSLSYSLVMAVV